MLADVRMLRPLWSVGTTKCFLSRYCEKRWIPKTTRRHSRWIKGYFCSAHDCFLLANRIWCYVSPYFWHKLAATLTMDASVNNTNSGDKSGNLKNNSLLRKYFTWCRAFPSLPKIIHWIRTYGETDDCVCLDFEDIVENMVGREESNRWGIDSDNVIMILITTIRKWSLEFGRGQEKRIRKLAVNTRLQMSSVSL